MHDELFTNQQALDRPALEKYAEKIGLNMVKFKAALDGHTFKAAVDKDLTEARELGVQGTPNFFINGRPMRGPCLTSSSRAPRMTRFAAPRC